MKPRTPGFRALVRSALVLLPAACTVERVEQTPEPDEPAERGEITVRTFRGPVQLTYEVVDGMAVHDDMVLGRAEDMRYRDARSAYVWKRGVMPYVWVTSDDPDCHTVSDAYCVDEAEALDARDADGQPIGAWAELVDLARSETSLSLVDYTACWAVAPCREEMSAFGEAVVKLRRPKDTGVVCDPMNNGTTQKDELLVTAASPGLWQLTFKAPTGDPQVIDLQVDAGLWPELVAFLLASNINAFAQNDEDAIMEASVQNDTVVLESRLPLEIDVTLVSPNPGLDATLTRRTNSCVGGNSCANDDCPKNTVCTNTWNSLIDDYDDTETVCRTTSGTASVGTLNWEVDGKEAYIRIPNPWWFNRSYGSMIHEVMHAAGFIHEQQRPDRKEYVQVADMACVTDANAFGDHQHLDYYGSTGPMDFASTMMYSSRSLCDSDAACTDMCLNARPDKCPDSICDPNDTYNDGLDPDKWLFRIKRKSGWNEGIETYGKGETGVIDKGKLSVSYGDQDALRTYAGDAFTQLGIEGTAPWMPFELEPGCTNEQDYIANDCKPGDLFPVVYFGADWQDRLGWSLAMGQFGDENHAIVTGIPMRSINGHHDVGRVGAVAVWEATHHTLPLTKASPMAEQENAHAPRIPTHAPHQLMEGESFAVDHPSFAMAGNDRFGWAVLALDIDGDGRDEIAVGAPGAGPNGAGAVYILRAPTSKSKHEPWAVVNLGLAGAGPDTSFGFALAGADIDGDGNEDLIVGAPGYVDPNGLHDGLVAIFRDISGTPEYVYTSQPSTGPAQAFGSSLAAGDFDGDGDVDLAVGAPRWGNDRGRVEVFHNANAVLTTWTSVEGSKPADQFGTALAAGEVLRRKDPKPADDLVVGAPGTAEGGRIVVFVGEPNVGLSTGYALTQKMLGIDANESGDRFGAALALAPALDTEPGYPTRDAWIFVGAPGEEHKGAQTGAVHPIRIYKEQFVGEPIFFGIMEFDKCKQEAAWGCGTMQDERHNLRELGHALAADEHVLVVGAPGSDPYIESDGFEESGLIRVYVRQRSQKGEDAWFPMRSHGELWSRPTTLNDLTTP